MGIITLAMALVVVYRAFFKPLKKYEDYAFKASNYDFIFLRRKAIDVIHLALQQSFEKRERASALIYLGTLYSKIKEWHKASDYYHQALELMSDEPFKYNGNYKKIIQTFIKAMETEKALYWLDHLLTRQSYDRRFKKLIYLKDMIDYGQNKSSCRGAKPS
jgi:tetratricopeptide (TPR) repeat protein